LGVFRLIACAFKEKGVADAAFINAWLSPRIKHFAAALNKPCCIAPKQSFLAQRAAAANVYLIM
jgi:hypothetical protein